MARRWARTPRLLSRTLVFFLTLAYVVLSHLSLEAQLPDLVGYRFMLWLGVAAGALALPSSWLWSGSGMWKVPQTYVMIGLIAAVPLSRIAHMWFGGAWPALSEFLVSGIVYFLVAGCTDTLGKFKFVVWAVVGTAVCLLAQAHFDYWTAGITSPFVIIQSLPNAFDDSLTQLPRLQSVGVLKDPNDFAQFLLVGLSLLTAGWRAGHRTRNLLIVLPTGLYLLYGVYLTGSRGALIGLSVILFLALESRLNRKLAAAVVVSALTLAIVLQAAGPRAISLSESSVGGRVEAWGTGIGLLRDSPLFGVGYGLFLDHSELTAHNSFVLCFAELGLFGYFLWLSLSVLTVLDLQSILARDVVRKKSPDLHHYAKAVRGALLTFLATSWFLSRTYAVTFYLLLGLGVVISQLVKSRHGNPVPAVQRSRWVLTGALALLSIAVAYGTVRLRNF